MSDERLSDRLMERRIVMLGDEVDDELARRVVSQLLLLLEDDPDLDICLYINSPGCSYINPTRRAESRFDDRLGARSCGTGAGAS